MKTLERIAELNSNDQVVNHEFLLHEDHYELLMDLAEAETDDEEEDLFKVMNKIPNLPYMASVIELWENTVGSAAIKKEIDAGHKITMAEKTELEETVCEDLSEGFTRYTVDIDGEIIRVQVVPSN
ncbi:hypothetical protein EI427_25145 [Flammeovirga pectinis]|uniref:Uncharacterized protein n=1 Tax=Flammeovirga pectinis TaxID=2494373 RepID=A0A3Q9FQU4_9BACT|nr:hypothetical protein [Flammeovirga pectinis]AZQ65502.1 hypothetical protein EI427_25145 [Flammeovirga pectinis]